MIDHCDINDSYANDSKQSAILGKLHSTINSWVNSFNVIYEAVNIRVFIYKVTGYFSKVSRGHPLFCWKKYLGTFQKILLETPHPFRVEKSTRVLFKIWQKHPTTPRVLLGIRAEKLVPDPPLDNQLSFLDVCIYLWTRSSIN